MNMECDYTLNLVYQIGGFFGTGSVLLCVSFFIVNLFLVMDVGVEGFSGV